MNTNTFLKTYCNIEKEIFLRRCIYYNIILPSLDCKKIDFDLLLQQQKRILNRQIVQLNSETKLFYKNIWLKLDEKEKTFFYYKRLEKRSHYMKKFNWLQNKQKIRRKNFHKQNSKKLKNKNKYDRNRYRSRQKFKKINNLIDSA